MSEVKHTPGPWETDCKEHDDPYQNIKVNSGYRNICTIWIDDAPVRDYNAEQKANARLIASAPELLETLKLMVTMAETGMCDFNPHDEYVMDKAKALIEKATGGAA